MKFLLDTHCHTIASGHAFSTVEEMAKYASHIGYKLIAITDHGPAMPGTAHLFHFRNLRTLPEKIYGVEILKGAEVNIMDYEGNVDIPEETLKMLDLVIASFHGPCIKPGTVGQNTKALLGAIENPYIHVIGHPGNPNFPIDIKTVVAAAKEHNTLIEINNSSLKPKSFRKGSMDNCCKILKECRNQGATISIGSDAHISYDIGNFSTVEEMLEELNVPEDMVINTSVERLKSFLKKTSKEK